MAKMVKAEPKYVIHMIANAHLDPVWLWDWREGLNEGIATCQTMADLLEEDGDFVFIRGEAAVYEHIQKHQPVLFKRIVKLVKQGRWDVVGGTYIQPDTNLPATETFCRHYMRGQRYFTETFGKPVTVAWAADSFGHSAGLPEVLANAGIRSIAFTRPPAVNCPISQPAFWWRGPAGSEILGYRQTVGWYGCERDEIKPRLDSVLKEAANHSLHNIGCLYGMGNHGGGTTRRLLADIRAWAKAHPEVKVVHSGLHGFFEALRAEVEQKGHDSIPVHASELNYVLRGCYSSVAKYKFAYRLTENLLNSVERTDTAIAALTKTAPADLHQPRDVQLFNSFHDILPGSSIERATDDQLGQLGYVQHLARVAQLDAINKLANRIKIQVPPVKGDVPSAVPMLLFNPLPYAYKGYVEMEVSLDYRPLMAYVDRVNEVPVQVRGADGKPRPFQIVDTEHSAVQNLPWRKRVVMPVNVPAMGWLLATVAYEEKAKVKALPGKGVTTSANSIGNARYSVKAGMGDDGVHIEYNGKPLFGERGLGVQLVEDNFGSWGAMDEDKASWDLRTILETWKVTHVEILEKGPIRATLFVRIGGRKSRLELTIHLYADRDAIDVAARVLFDERCARLKLVMPGFGDQATFDVPGGNITRAPAGEAPGGRWVKASGSGGKIGFASDGLYNFDLTAGDLRATICRATRYANDAVQGPDVESWRPAVDSGELKFNFVLSADVAAIERHARELENPIVAQLVHPHDGTLPATGSIAAIEPASLQIVALKPAEDGNGSILRVQETTGRDITAGLTWLGTNVSLGKLKANAIGTWRIQDKRGKLKVTPIRITELDR